MINLAILASGAGSNALNIIRHFKDSASIQVVLVASNKPGAGVLKIATDHFIPTYNLTRNNFYETEDFINELVHRKVDYIILAGFLWKVPAPVVANFEKHIINIHPALLPSYGGKGMYGCFVHEAVHRNKEPESGITIHYVNEQYDEGDIIFQQRVRIDESDGPKQIEEKVRALEIKYFAEILEKELSSKSR